MKNRRKQRSLYRQAIEALESRLLLSGTPDLTVAIGALPADIPTGYVLNVPITVTNNKASAVKGSMTLAVAFDDGSGAVKLATKVVSGTIQPGGHISGFIPATIPANAVIGTDTLTVTSTAGAYTTTTATASSYITWDFGNIPGLGSKPVSLTAVDPATGFTGVFTWTGPGMGSLSDPRGIWDMNLTGTTRDTKITMTPTKNTASHLLNLEQINATSMVGSITAPQTDFTADADSEESSFMNFTNGGLLALTMHDASTMVSNAHVVTVGSGDLATDALALTFNNVNDLAVNSMMPIASFTAASYACHVDQEGLGIMTSAYIGSVAITGNFTGIFETSYPEIYANSANPANGFAIASIKVGGNMDASEFSAEYGKIGPVTIGGFMDHGAEVYADYGSIGNVSVVGNMSGSSYIESEYGGIGTVQIGGSVDHNSYIEVGDQGNIGAVTIGGNLDHGSEVYVSDHGNIASVSIKGNMDNEAYIECDGQGNIGAVTIQGNLDHDAEIYIDYQGNIASVTVGGNMDNSAEIYISDGGNVGPVQIKGNFDHDAEIYTDYGDIAAVKIGGKMDNDAYIEIGNAGDIAGVTIAGNMDNSAEIYVDDGGNIGPVAIGGNMDHSAEVYTYYGNIASVKIGGNLDHSAEIYVDDGGDIGPVTVGGNMDHSAEIYNDEGDIGPVTIGGNLDNSAEVYADEGNIGDVKIAGNFDHNAEVYSDDGAVGIGDVSVGGDFSNGALVYAYGAAIASVKVVGNSLWTSGNSPKIYAYTTIGSISIGGNSVHADFEAGGSIGSITVGGLMQNGLVNLYAGGKLGAMTVGQLDGTTVKVANSGTAGTRADFTTQNSAIGKFVIKGIKTEGTYLYMTNGSKILAWIVDSINFGGTSTGGDGLIEYRTGKVVNLPSGVTRTVIP